MSDQEFEVLDELYFVQSFNEVSEMTGLEAESLKQILKDLIDKGWVRCLERRDGESETGKIDFQKNYQHYFYLATKAGLLAHNSR